MLNNIVKMSRKSTALYNIAFFKTILIIDSTAIKVNDGEVSADK
ncbi:hypothetical protein ACIQZI_16050 [Peribacillus sp. NPDC096379]